jgi:integrase
VAKHTTGKLTAVAVKAAKVGMVGDGGGLWLAVSPTGGKSWLFRYASPTTRKARAMGLGSANVGGSAPGTVGLAEARELATALRRRVKGYRAPDGTRVDGVDPLELEAERKAGAKAKAALKAASAMTFRQVAEGYIESNKAGWKNADHLSQWQGSLRKYVYPKIGDMHVSAIGKAEVCLVLEAPTKSGKSLWAAMPETASRLRGRIEVVLNYAVARDWRPAGDNPARWKGHLSAILPAKRKLTTVKHHPALPWREAGQFMESLRGTDGVAARALEFMVLTVGRKDEVQSATWGEIDLKAAVWTLPGSRMKNGNPHSVPLSDAALDLLRTLRPKDAKPDDLVFPSQLNRKLANTTMADIIKRLGHGGDATVHGFRSTLTDWAAECTSYPPEIYDAALAHSNSDPYRRTKLLDKRRALMRDWATHCGRVMPVESAEVVQLRG